jgi:hypothetical protein
MESRSLTCFNGLSLCSPAVLNIPRKTQQNGTLFLHVLMSPTSMKQESFVDLQNVMRSLIEH